MAHRGKILLADDTLEFRIDLGKDLERLGFNVDYASNSIELRDRISEEHQVLLLDLRMPGKDGRFSVIAGFDDLRYIKQERKLDTAVILLSDDSNGQLVREALRFDAFDFFNKADLAKERSQLFVAIDGVIAQMGLLEEQREPGPSRPWGPLRISYSLRFRVVPTGIFRLFSRGGSSESLIKYTLENRTDEAMKVSIRTWVDRYAGPQISPTTIVPARGVAHILSSPLIDLEKVQKLRDIERAELQHMVQYSFKGEELEERLPSEFIDLHPMTTMCWVLESAEKGGRSRFLGEYIAAWVTPRSVAIEEMLRLAAVRYHPRNLILGYPLASESAAEPTALVREQIKAFYDALKHESGIVYLDASSISFRGRNSKSMQRVRLPEESLEQRVANCIDGAVLFASLIELADMHPVIARGPHHALVGWETLEGSGEFEFLETTMLRNAEFEEALAAGSETYRNWLEDGRFDSGEAVIINIRDSRLLGIYPMQNR